MNITEVLSEAHFVVFEFSFESNMASTARLIMSIFEEKPGQESHKLLTTVLKQPFKKELKISELQPVRAYKFTFVLENGPDLLRKTIYASTTREKQQESNTEGKLNELLLIQQQMAYNTKKPSKCDGLSQSEDLLYKAATTSTVNTFAFKNEKEILKKVMDGRKASSTYDFINESYKIAKPAFNKKERLKRTLLVAQGIELYENVYGYRESNETRNGMQFGGNDWFMGPFYSYDKNSQEMQRNHQKKLLDEQTEGRSDERIDFGTKSSRDVNERKKEGSTITKGTINRK